MNAAEVEIRVQAVESNSKLFPSFVLHGWPSMQLHEDATRWIADLAVRSRSRAHQRNVAYALSHWHTYCLALGIDYRHASSDDLIAYKSAMSTMLADSTGEPLSAGTVAQRISAIAQYYEHGRKKGWNRTATDLLAAIRLDRETRDRQVDEVHATPIDEGAARFAPPPDRKETDIRPLAPTELKDLLDQLGPSAEQLETGDRRPQRDRIIAEWLVYVGLRISEAICPNGKRGLTCNQILMLAPDPGYPHDHCLVNIYGKGGKWRPVAVPNWLILKTLDYIQHERRHATRDLRSASNKVFVGGLHSGSANVGRPITQRAFQKAFAAACIRAGLVHLVKRPTDDHGQSRLIKVARHCPHDLRHTYAVSRYYAERQLGNPEPWKPIQAQLGHASLKTTIDTYLAFVSIDNAWGRDLRRASVRELAGLPHG